MKKECVMIGIGVLMLVIVSLMGVVSGAASPYCNADGDTGWTCIAVPIYTHEGNFTDICINQTHLKAYTCNSNVPNKYSVESYDCSKDGFNCVVDHCDCFGAQTPNSSCSPISGNNCVIHLNDEVNTTFSGADYSIKLVYIDATYAQFQVVDSLGNRQTTTKLTKDGPTYRLLDGTQIKVTDIFYQAGGQMYSVVILEPTTCTDTDGGLNYPDYYYAKGDAIGMFHLGNGILNTTIGTYSDYCDDNKFISEYYCDNSSRGVQSLVGKNYVAEVSYGCPNGCKDGACVSPITCTDSDALNYYLKGNVRGIATCEDAFRVDECYNSRTKLTGGSGDYVVEAICSGSCPAGQMTYCSYGCRSGACLKSAGLQTTRPGIIGWLRNLFG